MASEIVGVCDLCGDMVDSTQGREAGFCTFCYRCVTPEEEDAARISVALAALIDAERESPRD